MIHPKQTQLALHRGNHGGWRPGSGAQIGTEPEDPPSLASGLRGSLSLPCHREGHPWAPLVAKGGPFRKGAERSSFRLLEFSIQDDHLHAIVEADGPAALGRGMKSLASRFAKAVNRVLGGRGPVLRDR